VRTVREIERAGVAAIHIEDQITPKRCGHLDGKEVIPLAEMEKNCKRRWRPARILISVLLHEPMLASQWLRRRDQRRACVRQTRR